MDDNERRRAEYNKEVRGYIIRSLVKGYHNSLILRQLIRVMTDAGILTSPDISDHLDYLIDGGYIKFTDDKIKSHSAYRDDAVINLTKKGVDLVEGRIEEPGVGL